MAHEKESNAGVESEIDALFVLPLEEFTGARNGLAARLKKTGQRLDAERVKALAKPSVTAWAVNQLFWKQRSAFFELIAAGERVLAAQTLQLSGKTADVREPLEARREVLTRLLRLAAVMLEAAGHSPTPDKMRRLSTTLEAISILGASPGAKPDGRLTDDIDPPGFELFATLIPSSPQVMPKPTPAPPPRARKPEDSAQREIVAAKAALQNAESALADARIRTRDADAALQDAATRAKEAEKLKREAEERFEQARALVSAMADESEKAAKSLKEAERAVEKASRQLQSLL